MHEKLQSLLLIKVIGMNEKLNGSVLVRNRFLVAVMEIERELT